MKFPSGSGQALCLHNGRVATLSFGPGHYPEGHSVSDGANEITDDLSRDDRFDVYFHQSDDGSQIYHSVHVLGLGSDAKSVRALTQAEVDAHKMKPVQAVMAAVMAGKIDPSDVIFAKHVFSSPAFLQSAWASHNHDLDAACATIVRDVFGA